MTKRTLVSLTVSLLTVTAVHADDARVDATDAPAPAAPASRLTLPAGKIALAVALQSDLTADAAGDAVSLAPDLAYGVTNRFTVALVHTTQGGSGFWSGLGGSLCIMGERCADTYSSGALLSKLDLFHSAKLDIAALGGVIYNVDPFRVGVGLGAEALVQAGPLAVHFKPTIYIGVNERDAMVGPNKEFVNLPLAVLVPATKRLQLGVQSGVAAPVEGFAAAYRVPVAVMGNLALGAWSAGLAFSFDRVTGGDDTMPAPGAFDARSLTVSLGYVR